MFLKLLLLLTIVPAVELYLLIAAGSRIGVLPTVGVILLTGVVGASLARREGLRTLAEAQKLMEKGQVPADAMLEGLLILAAGVVLLTPGFLTDFMGFLLLLPPVRARVRETLKGYFKTRVRVVRPSDPFGFPGGPGSRSDPRSSESSPSPDPFAPPPPDIKPRPARPDVIEVPGEREEEEEVR